MKKQFGLEWNLKSGHNGWKSIGYDCPEEAERQMKRKIKSKSCTSAYITWNYVGNDVPEEELFEEHFYKGLYKYRIEMFGMDVYIENDIREMGDTNE